MAAAHSFDPQIALATSMHAQPGVYALLLGSGVSIGAGIPTGWGVFRALMIQASAAQGGDDVLGPESTDDDIETWWAAHGDGRSLGYSSLLELLAPTSAARHALLANFFEPTEEEREDGLKAPGQGHEAIADLVERGSVRVILTTNFDRLTERALEARGISYQVLATSTAITGMEPLAHARCTIVKLHGDYTSLQQRNTVDELSEYPQEQNDLLARIFDEYGLIVSGWSAEWDHALVTAMESSPSRRYPWFWAQVGSPSYAAKSLIAGKRAALIDGVAADDLFSGLVRRLEAIDSLTLTTASASIAVAQVKRLLPNPLKWIELRDLFEAELKRVAEAVDNRPAVTSASSAADIQAVFDHIRSAVDRLVHMFFTGVRLDRDKQHTDLWVWTIDRAMRVWKVPVGPYYEWWRDVQHYPPMLLLQAGFMGALLAEHEDVVLALATRPKWRSPITLRDPAPAFEVLDPRRIDANTVNSFPRWEGKRLELPQAHLLGEELRPVAMDAAGGPEDYMMLVSDAQYRLALAMQALPGGLGGPFLGLYVYEEGRRFETIPAEERFRASGDAAAWGWADTSDGSEFDQALLAIREYFRRSGVGW